MAHISLQAEQCRIVVKNGKVRFQAMKYDLNGELLDQVTVTLPLQQAYKFNYIEMLDDPSQDGGIALGNNKNRIENLTIDEDRGTKEE